jgi:hypothetical protein
MEPKELVVLPEVKKVSGLVFDNEDYVKLQYESNDKVYEIRFPIEEVLQMEEWFIMFRRQFRGPIAARMKSSTS